MLYTYLELKNFRSYKDFAVELSPSVNIVVGPNASGKTNLLEALLVASRGASYRGSDSELINYKADWARINVLGDQERVVKISRGDRSSHKELHIDQTPVKRITRNHIAPITLFEPDHLRLIHGSPEIRRDYLDNLLEQLEIGYKETLQRYRRALSQRNRLLKNRPAKLADHVFVWDVKLSEYGAQIIASRHGLLKRLNKDASKLYSQLSGQKSKVELKYRTNLTATDYASALLRALQERLPIDAERGFTGLGPHRDDVEFRLNRQPAAQTASRGETRTLVLMCKITELQLLEAEREEQPILLLDDVFSELDGSRRRALTEYLQPYQTIITTTDADAIVQHFTSSDYHIIPTKVES